MKALPMLDHVMLWVARFFTGSFFLLGLFWSYTTIKFFYSNGSYSLETLIGKISSGPLLGFCIVILGFLSFLGLWILHNQLARIYEVVFSVIWIGLLLHYAFIEWLDVVAHLMPWMIGLIGFGSIFGAAMRTRSITKTVNASKNPVNLVNPV